MKIRSGFVSNSSSSSFVVGFKKRPKSAQEVAKYLFKKGQELYPNPYADLGAPGDRQAGFPIEQVAGTVFNDFTNECNETPLTREKMIEIVSSGWFDGHPEWDFHYDDKETMEQRRARWDEETRKTNEAAAKVVDKFIKENPDLEFYEFHYSDNDGDYFCAMEHGDLFEKVPHLCISNH